MNEENVEANIDANGPTTSAVGKKSTWGFVSVAKIQQKLLAADKLEQEGSFVMDMIEPEPAVGHFDAQFDVRVWGGVYSACGLVPRSVDHVAFGSLGSPPHPQATTAAPAAQPTPAIAPTPTPTLAVTTVAAVSHVVWTGL